MMTKHILLAAIICIALSFKENEETENIWIDQTKIDKVIEYEKALSSESEFLKMTLALSTSVYPDLDKHRFANPFIVKRKQTGFLPVYAEYFYTLPDSVLRYISYDWERDRYGNFFDKQKIWKEESKKLKEYNTEYERIKLVVVKKFGKPAAEDTEPQKKKSNSGRGDYLTREANWDTDKFHAELDMVFESMTYRIRLSYYWKN